VLYKLKQSDNKTTFVRLTATSMQQRGLLESHMEQWLADNPTAVLPEDEARVLVISQEKPFENVTDVLAIDAQGNLVIIEVKRGQTPRDVIAQALEYASDVADWDYDRLNKTAIQYFEKRKLNFTSLADAYSTTFGIPVAEFSELQFNQQQRVFIVGESIEEKIERTARWLLKRGVSITCLSYTCFVSNDQTPEMFIDFNEVVRPVELHGGGYPKKTSPQPPTEDEAVGRLPDSLQEIYWELKRRVGNFGGEVRTRATANYLIFESTLKFAEIVPRKSCLSILVRPEGFAVPESQAMLVHGILVTRKPDAFGWSCNHEFKVDVNSDLEAVTTLLHQSYQAVQAGK